MSGSTSGDHAKVKWRYISGYVRHLGDHAKILTVHLRLCLAYTSVSCLLQMAVNRKTREWWPLLTNETEVNGDSKSTNERDPSLIGSLASSCRYRRLLTCLGCSVTPQYNIFFSSPYTISIYVSPSPNNLDMQSCRAAYL